MQTTQNVNKTPIFCLHLLITLLSVVKKQKMPKTFIVVKHESLSKLFQINVFYVISDSSCSYSN